MRRSLRVALIMLILIVAACDRTIESSQTIDNCLSELQRLTTPPESNLTAYTGLSRDGESARAEWQVETGMSWEAYAVWIQRQPNAYRQIEQKDAIVLSRTLEGDTVYLTLRNQGQRGGRRVVAASFEARPF